MAQKILLRRGPVANIASVATQQGELLLVTGSISDLAGPFITMTGTAGTGTSTIVGKLYEGTTAPTVSSQLTGTPFYATGNNTLYRLNHAGNQALDLSGNLENTTVTTLTVTNLTTSNVNLSGNITGSNMLLTGDADINGNITLGGSITIGNQTTDNIQVGGEFTSDLIPDVDSTYNLGSNAKRWLNIYVDNVSGSTADFSGAVTIGGNTGIAGTLTATSGISSSAYLYAAGALDVDGNAAIGGTLGVTGAATFSSTVAATTGISSSGWLYIAGDADVNGTSYLQNTFVTGALAVTTGISSSGYLYAAGALDIDGTSTLTGNTTVGGTLGVTGDFAVNTNTFTVAAASGDTGVAGTLTVAGQTDLNGNVNIGNAATDTVTVTADIDSNLIPFATNTYDLGSSSDKWRFGYFVSASIESLTISGIDPTAQDLDDVMNNGASTDNDFSLTKNGDQQITHQGATGNLLISSNNGNVQIEGTVFNGDNVTIPGDLTVSGTTTTINSTEVNIGDNIITLNAAGTVADGGVQVIDTTGTAHTGSLLWNANNDYWYAGISGSTHYRVATFTNASPVSNAIPVIDANKRLVASSITDNGTLVSVDANVEITGSILATGAGTVNGLTDSSSTGDIRFSYINASKQFAYLTPAVAGDLIQWNGTAMVASNVVDGGTF